MIDSHCHLNHEDFINNVDKYINDANEFGVHAFLIVGWDLESSKLAVKIAEEHKNIYAAVGIHPCDTLIMKENDLVELEGLLSNKKVICIGEIGLDYHWNKLDNERELQKKYFIEQIKLANKYKLPISVHSRDANEETYNILKENTPLYGGIMHCYSGGKEMLNKYLDLGMYISFGGPLTFKNSVSPKESAIKCPINKILIETDCPYLAPQAVRGQQNMPQYVRFVLKELSELKNISESELDDITTNNFERLFHVKTR